LGDKTKPAIALAVAGFGKIFVSFVLSFRSHDAIHNGLLLPTGQTTGDRGAGHYNLFGERLAHFNCHKKTHWRHFVNGIMEITFAIV
jgi:hypothetical protein